MRDGRGAVKDNKDNVVGFSRALETRIADPQAWATAELRC